MNESKSLAIMSLKLIAAKAEKLAYDLEHGRLWEGELGLGLQEIEKALDDARAEARRN